MRASPPNAQNWRCPPTTPANPPRRDRTHAAPGHRRNIALPTAFRPRTLAGLSLVELKVEIPAGSANSVDDVLLELGVEGWSLLEDAIAKRAWIIGIFPDEA